jgi:cytochrome c biogenesis protein CcdA
MTPGQMANGLASGFIAATGSAFVIIYGVLAKLWKSVDGRMLMTLGLTVAFTGVLTTTLTIQGFTAGGDFLRFIQAGLLVIVGLLFLLYSVRVWKMQFGRFRRRKRNDRQGS